MNTKFFFALLIIAMMATACTPIVNEVQLPANPNAANNVPALVPVTGNSTTETIHRDAQVPAKWSGEILSSNNNNPDLKLNVNVNTDQQTTAECTSEDSQPQPQSGCFQ